MDNMEHLGDFAVTLCEESVDWNSLYQPVITGSLVTLCEESVDWNLCCSRRPIPPPVVTLCEESVDWNQTVIQLLEPIIVTLCEESVDWNHDTNLIDFPKVKRHSLRGECGLKWLADRRETCTYGVTLCEESVDWNHMKRRGDPKVNSHSLRGECGLKSTIWK